MILVFNLGIGLHVCMRTKFENGILCNDRLSDILLQGYTKCINLRVVQWANMQ